MSDLAVSAAGTDSNDSKNLPLMQKDLVVVGDEIESVITAVSAAKQGIQVCLIRQSTGLLGGLSTRGGLSYMDITPETLSGLFKQFLKEAGVKRVALDPKQADTVLRQWLSLNQIAVFSGCNYSKLDLSLSSSSAGLRKFLIHGFKGDVEAFRIACHTLIDATPDGTIAEKLGLPYLSGLSGLVGDATPFIGISAVFRLAGVSVEALQAFEKNCRNTPGLPGILEDALPHHPEALRKELITRPTYAPADMDYLDILNPVIGIHYHGWRWQNQYCLYEKVPLHIDGANISRLPDGTLGFNGLVGKIATDHTISNTADSKSAEKDFSGPCSHGPIPLPEPLNYSLDELVALSEGSKPVPDVFFNEMQAFELYLRKEAGLRTASVIPPESLYIRQTRTFQMYKNMTAQSFLLCGVPKEKAVGTFSYWLDVRGVNLWEFMPNQRFPKPFFNVGLESSISNHPGLENFGLVGRSAGYSPLGQGLGRIVQHNALIGEALGIAAAKACHLKQSLFDLVCSTSGLNGVQDVLKKQQAGNLQTEGRAVVSAEALEGFGLIQKDEAIIRELRARPFQPVAINHIS
ncbi:MAG: FAD-dependent oxidoreductase [Cyanobacteria bacterium P01_H01_bin.74]